MTTVNDLIKYLETLPSETECTVMCTYSDGWNSGVEEVDMDLTEYTGNVEYTDFTNNQFMKKEDYWYKKKCLTFGEH